MLCLAINLMRRIPLDARAIHAALLTSLVGCGVGHEAAVYPVAGTVTVNGQPAANVMVAFHPLAPAGTPAALPVASTGSDGTYRLMTYTAGDGAPAGEYAVTVVWPDDAEPRDECAEVATHDRLEGRYVDPARSPWRVNIGPGSNTVPLRADLPAGRLPLPSLPETVEK